jgi:GT2 family glycosyltransferase
MISDAWQAGILLGAYGIAIAWSMRAADMLRNMPTVANLTQFEWNNAPASGPSLTVVVPARNEAEKIAATIEALLKSDYKNLQIIAVDDRSTDVTRSILDELTAKSPDRMRVLHIDELADGWVGKTFAMQLALEQAASDYLLFTDADVLFSPAILRKSIAYAERTGAAHLVVMPTTLVQSWRESFVLGFLQVLGMWVARPWRVPDVKARRDAIGVGAFNMVRREALLALGGMEPQRMVILEDVHLALRFKAAGLPQRVAVAPGQVLVHWAKGLRGLVRVMTKNLFSGTNFNPLILLLLALWIVLFFLAPLAGLAWWYTIPPALIVLFAIAACYRTLGSYSLIPARYGWLYPFGVFVFLYVMLQSMVVTFLIGGVRWRDTKYSLSELRQHNNPRRWERAAAESRRLARLRAES